LVYALNGENASIATQIQSCILICMNKGTISLFATIGMVAGGSAPMLFGDNSLIDGWGILGGLVGGFAGIWLGVMLAKR